MSIWLAHLGSPVQYLASRKVDTERRIILFFLSCLWLALPHGACLAGDATVKGYTKVINKNGAYTELATPSTDEKRSKE
jgi:hypothetical protein